jgi:glycosyltransferase involved in cell wall biosynthesis
VTVAVVMPFYRDDRCFPAALASVMAQTRLPDEIVVVDDASPLGTATSLAGLSDIVTVIRLAVNSGPGMARQVGTNACNSELVAYLDSDDQWPPEFLERCVERMNRSPQPPAVYTSVAKLLPDDTLKFYDGKPLQLDVREAIVRFQAYPSLGMVFRRAALEEIGGWNCSRLVVEDWDLIVRFLDRHGPIPLLPDVFARYRVGYDIGRRNSQGLAKLRRWRQTAACNRELIDRHFGPGAHRRRFAQAIRDRADTVGGLNGRIHHVVSRLLGPPLDQALPPTVRH